MSNGGIKQRTAPFWRRERFLEEQGISLQIKTPTAFYLMEDLKVKVRSAVPRNSFVKYEAEAVNDMVSIKPPNSNVSGRLLSLLYARLLFWSKYAKHKFNNKRFFFKSLKSLGEEISYSTKQISRALKVLLELKLIIRHKLLQHRYYQVYFYHLPRSPYSVEVEAVQRHEYQSVDRGAPEPVQRVPQQVAQASVSGAAVGAVPSSKAESSVISRENVRFISKITSNKKNTLKTIVDKCLFYGKVGIVEGQGIMRRECFGFG